MSLKEDLARNTPIDINEKYRHQGKFREWSYSNTILESLIEMYRKPNFEWVEEFVDELYETQDEIISKKYKVELIQGYSKPNTQVLEATYNSQLDIYKITLSENGIEDICKKINKKELIVEIMEFIVHEETHRQQNKLDNFKQIYYPYPDDNNLDHVIKHISQQVEIDANGRGVAYELKNKFPDDTKIGIITRIIKGSDDLDILSDKARTLIKGYRYISGYVWRRFLQQAYEYLDSPRISGGLAEYREWLEKNKPD
jgi:hypothetical protein